MNDSQLEAYRRVVDGQGGLVTLTPRALWRLTGPDAARYLNGQLTNDVLKLPDGHAQYGAICSGKGRMEGDVHVARHDNTFYLDANIGQRESLGARLDKYLIADDAQFEDISDEWHLVHVFGTDARSAADGFAVRHARFGLPGCDIWLTKTSTKPTGDEVPPEVLEMIRLERAIPRWGAELTPTTLPPEAGPRMLAAISYTKGCYVGQEVIARLKSVGHVNRSLVLLVSTADAPPASAKLQREGKEVGTVTSSGYSPAFGAGIALAYLQRQFIADGTVVEADGIKLTVTPPLPATT